MTRAANDNGRESAGADHGAGSRVIRVPIGAEIRTSVEHGAAFVTIAPAGLPVDIVQAMAGRPGVHQLLTHDTGTTWPDRIGCRLANSVLDRGDGLVIAQFESLADALAFRKRLGDSGGSR